MAYPYVIHQMARSRRRNRWQKGWQGNCIGFRDLIAVSLMFFAVMFTLIYLGVVVEAKNLPSENDVFVVTQVDKKQRELQNIQTGEKRTVYDVKMDDNVTEGWLVMYNPKTRRYYEVQMNEVVKCLKERE